MTAAVLALMLRSKNQEIALLLTVAAGALLLLSVMDHAAEVVAAVQDVVTVSGINKRDLTVMLKVIGLCLITEFAANTCRDAGSSALAANVTLAGRLTATVISLPLYTEILNVVLSLING